MDIDKRKEEIIAAGEKAVEHLIKVAEEKIITGKKDEDLSADRLKNAAATKKLAIFDAFDILKRIDEERRILEGNPKEDEKKSEKKPRRGFAERMADNK